MDIKSLHQLPFKEILNFIEEKYQYTPSAFKNGDLINGEDENQGSAKVLYFAQMNTISKEDTLLLFAEHYQAVLEDVNGSSHQNIRNFMQYGWEGVAFENIVLLKK
ncbi:HopJ type III effector protein [Flavobacterium sp. xlx-214]|uniref:HopJ type III effector protein n=1 Tax=unclassified Flavobacterium TaxID=196869 RepID=UPI0013D2F765|nr:MULTISPECIES: HopJ type III effector protein [unclassified Flavobacterium]MBA5792573.1 HopJ type III effector protein [Flavobacterium sp. xlx-221]QMI83722.1 HopJ type III effector protein [Flavobacterium sp. xlx-214]